MSEQCSKLELDTSKSEIIPSRRSILRLGGVGMYMGLSAAAGVRTWDTIAAIKRDHNRVNITPLESELSERAPLYTSVLYLPGLKNTWNESEENLAALKPSLSKLGKIASLGYSNLGFNEEEVVDTVIDHCEENKVDKLYLYGGSFSGMVSTSIAPKIKEAGIDVPLIFCDSSPSDRSDVIDQFTFKCMAFAGRHDIPVPEAIRYMIELGERIGNKNERSLAQIVDQSFEQLGPQACSTNLTVSQVRFIDNFELSEHSETLGDTQLVYLGNKHDVVVNYDQAYANWKQQLPKNMIQSPYDTGDAYHASPKYGEESYNRKIDHVIQDLGLIPRKKAATRRVV